MDSKNKITHFYHIYANGNFEEAITEHLRALKYYGLGSQLNKFYIGFIGEEKNQNKAIKLIETYKIPFEIVAKEEEGYEQVTLEKLRDYSFLNDGLIFYAHTKGAADNSLINTTWRSSMCYYNVVLWQNIVENILNNGYTTGGCHWLNAYGHQFFGGNYWWATTDYIKTLPPLKYDNRWWAEAWIGEGRRNKPYDANPGWPSFDIFTTKWVNQ